MSRSDDGPSDGHQTAEVTSILVKTESDVNRTAAALYDVITTGTQGHTNLLAVQTAPGASVLAELVAAIESRPPTRLGTVSVGTETRPRPGTEVGDDPTQTIQQVAILSPPVDLATLGETITETTREWETTGAKTMILVDSVSSLLAMEDFDTVYRFLATLLGSLLDADAVGVVIADTRAQDSKSVAALEQLFDAVVSVRAGGELSVDFHPTRNHE